MSEDVTEVSRLVSIRRSPRLELPDAFPMIVRPIGGRILGAVEVIERGNQRSKIRDVHHCLMRDGAERVVAMTSVVGLSDDELTNAISPSIPSHGIVRTI